MLVALAIWSARRVVQKVRNQPMALNVPPGVWWALLVVVLIFTGVRNLPAFVWLSP
jgi:hypothetical protein